MPFHRASAARPDTVDRRGPRRRAGHHDAIFARGSAGRARWQQRSRASPAVVQTRERTSDGTATSLRARRHTRIAPPRNEPTALDAPRPRPAIEPLEPAARPHSSALEKRDGAHPLRPSRSWPTSQAGGLASRAAATTGASPSAGPAKSARCRRNVPTPRPSPGRGARVLRPRLADFSQAQASRARTSLNWTRPRRDVRLPRRGILEQLREPRRLRLIATGSRRCCASLTLLLHRGRARRPRARG